MKKLLFYISFCVLLSIQGLSNNINIPNLSKYPDSIQINKLLEEGKKYFNNAPDTSFILIKKALDIAEKNNYENRIPEILRQVGNSLFFMSKFDEALKYYNKSLEYSKKVNDDLAQANALKNIGIIYLMQGDFKNAVAQLKKALPEFNKVGDKKGLASTYQVLGAININIGNYSKALAYAQKALKYYKEIQDTSGMAKSYGNIGNIHAEQKNFKQALKYYQIALLLLKNLEDKLGTAKTYSNIGSIYNDIKQYNKAIKEFEEAIKIYSELQNKSGLADAYLNIGRSYEKLKQYDKAIKYFNKSLRLRKEIDDKNGISQAYTYIADLYISKQQYHKAILNAQKSLKIAKKIGALPQEIGAYEALYKTYELIRNYEKAFYYHKLLTSVKDSVFNLGKVKALEELETKYQVEKKEQELEKQRLLLSKQEVQRKALLGGILLLILLALVIYINLRQKKKSNLLLEAQKAKIEEIHKELKSSITYAQRIQEASLASKSYLKQLLPEYFIIFKPRDIVSGDFYWWRKVNNKIIITIADCTGHGVPGALMSMLGLSLLKEAIINEQITKPKEILEFMRNGILDIFAQQKKYDTQDGMDMAIIALDFEQSILEYAGANNPIYLLRTSDKQDLEIIDIPETKKIVSEQNENYKLYEFKPDRMPIGKYHKMTPFSQVTVKLLQNDMIYMMSDGYQDQFGGENNKKFTKKKLKTLLSNIFNLPVKQQKQILEKTLNEWKNGYPQTDDITVMGIKNTQITENQKA